VAHTGISRKIGSEAERSRLRRIIKENSEGVPGGFIVRTAGQGAEEADLIADITFLANLWKGIKEKAEKRPAPALLHADLDIVERILRDHLGLGYKTIWVDSEDEYERVVRFVERFQPDLLDRVKLYTRETPIFDKFNITQELEKALKPKVWLKSGGYLVINQTEALVAIDVNTGKYVGKSDRLEDTIVKTNLEAAEEVVRQMRLRDLGGIIVVDFIDMDDRANRKKVALALESAMRTDRAPSKTLAFNDFGLVAITRKRVKQSLERALCSPCPSCQGSGHVKSVPTVIYSLLGEARRIGKKQDAERGVVVRCNPDVAKELKSRSNTYLQELEQFFGAGVIVKSDVTLAREDFDID
jgi:ribonuclease G